MNDATKMTQIRTINPPSHLARKTLAITLGVAAICVSGWLVLRLLGLIPPLWNSAASTSRADSDSPLICEEAIWDFGIVDQAKTHSLTHTFHLENGSANTLRIGEAETGCGCIVAKDAPTEIAGESSADFTVTVQLAGQPGRFQKFVTVPIESPELSKLTLTIRGIIAANSDFYTVPAQVDFGTVREGEVKSRTVKVARYDGTPVQLVSVTPETEALTVSDKIDRDATDAFVQLTLSLDGSQWTGEETTSGLTVLTDHPAHPSLRIPFKLRFAKKPDDETN